jgi:hypothetical protein
MMDKRSLRKEAGDRLGSLVIQEEAEVASGCRVIGFVWFDLPVLMFAHVASLTDG